jgi:hypothetical protein
MRIQHPKEGDTKRTTKFLWFPKRINHETRWLEVASWKSILTTFTFRGQSYWRDVSWVDY